MYAVIAGDSMVTCKETEKSEKYQPLWDDLEMLCGIRNLMVMSIKISCQRL